MTRLLLVATFFEDAFRVITDLHGQARFLNHFYSMPMGIAILFLLCVVMLSVSASLGIVLAGRAGYSGKSSRQDRAMLTIQERASYVLIVHILVQQALYGRDAPATGGNISFLVRNACVAGSFLMVAATARLKKGLAAFPQGLLGAISHKSRSSAPSSSSAQKALEYMQLASRIMLVLLPLDFVSSLGFVGTLMTVPVMLAVLVGYRTKASGVLLMIFYAAYNLLTSAFWTVRDSSPYGLYSRDVKQYEFVQTMSIMGGVLMLVLEGPGAISIDQQQNHPNQSD